jgi:hypothetical protein
LVRIALQSRLGGDSAGDLKRRPVSHKEIQLKSALQIGFDQHQFLGRNFRKLRTRLYRFRRRIPIWPNLFGALVVDHAIDPATAKIIGRYPVSGIESPHGIALDVNAGLVFVAGEDNNKLAVVDLTNMQVLATYPVGKDPDVLAFGPGLKRLYVSAESGDVTDFREDGKTLALEGSFSIPHAHTVCVDPKTHLVYFPLQNIDGHPVLRIMEPTRTH